MTSTRKRPSRDEVEVCRSEHTSEWLGALYVYKGLLVAVGVYMAWETRHVKIPALNDSQYIGMSVYNVVITSIIVIVAANIIGERTTLAYVIITTLIFTSTTTTLCLLFIPKILTIWRRAEGDPIVESMGLKIQSNTRRLLTEDKREKYYRAEVQNKVYRREMLKLDQELHKLHRWMEAPDSPTSSTRSFDLSKKKGSMSSMTSDTGRVGGEGDVGICDVEGCGGGTGDRGIAGGGEGCGGGRMLGEMLGAPHTQYLQSDDTTVRRVKRERMFRSLHRSLPSLTLGCPPRRPSDTRLPADGAENEGESFGPPQVFFDARRFHEDQEEARRQAEEEEDCDDDDDDEERSPRLGHFPASPHPLQRSRLVKRSPIKPRMEPEDEGIVDLRYTLNFSTPLLHGVTEADLPFSISTHVQHGPRVSFLDQDAYHSYDSSPEIHKSSLNACSFSSPEVRRPSRNTFSSTDIRLQIECSGVIPDEKLSPLVEYRVNDLDVLCPYGHSPRPQNQEVLTQPPPGAAAGGGGGGGGQEVNSSASEVRRYTSNGAVSRRSLAGTANHSARHGKAARRSASRPTSDSTTISNAARSSGHIFSAVIVHHVANVHM
ncbi:uncharacterized protein [Panulirus ornatus]|uniref:uncharacterized protein n=1 Tax=Panulirus ornatus TaxID=150431 RepID=UPI003A8A96F2